VLPPVKPLVGGTVVGIVATAVVPAVDTVGAVVVVTEGAVVVVTDRGCVVDVVDGTVVDVVELVVVDGAIVVDEAIVVDVVVVEVVVVVGAVDVVVVVIVGGGGGAVVVVVVCVDTHVPDRLKFVGKPSAPIAREPSAVPDNNTSSVGVVTYACIADGGPNVVTVTVPKLWNVTVSDSKMYVGFGPGPLGALCGKTKCHTTPPGGGTGPSQFCGCALPWAGTWPGLSVLSGPPGTSS
jgi:hypothetical protein